MGLEASTPFDIRVFTKETERSFLIEITQSLDQTFLAPLILSEYGLAKYLLECGGAPARFDTRTCSERV